MLKRSNTTAWLGANGIGKFRALEEFARAGGSKDRGAFTAAPDVLFAVANEANKLIISLTHPSKWATLQGDSKSK